MTLQLQMYLSTLNNRNVAYEILQQSDSVHLPRSWFCVPKQSASGNTTSPSDGLGMIAHSLFLEIGRAASRRSRRTQSRSIESLPLSSAPASDTPSPYK